MQYASTAAVGSKVSFSAEVLKRGKRLVTVEVRAHDKKGRLVAVGTVTKSHQ